jgi:hypothetical protein
MPLLDHFHAPVSLTHEWEAFHARWAVALTDALNEMLPADRYLAEPLVTVGTRIEADVAELERPARAGVDGNGETGGVAVQTWSPPAVTRMVPITFPGAIEAQVFQISGGKQLVGVIELVSPANKDRAEHRRACAVKTAAYLHRGIGVIVVDIVTSRRGRMHNEVLDLIGQENTADLADIYTVAYRPVHREEANQLDIWERSLALGEPMPVLPLALRGADCVPVDLEATYTEARRRLHL